MKRIRIFADTDPESPRAWDNVGTMVCWHSRYNLGDEQPRSEAPEFLEQLAIDACPRLEELIDYWRDGGYDWLRDSLDYSHDEAVEASDSHIQSLCAAVLERHYIILPLYLYDHSGLSMSCSGFTCPWDSGQVGYIYCTVQRGIDECTSIENATKCLQGEVEVYAQYLQGDVYGYVVEECPDDPDEYGLDQVWESVDSCWGFYGSDPFTNGMADHIDEELHDQLRNAEVEYSY